MKHKLESRLSGETSIISDMQKIPPLWQKAKSLLMKVKEESEKVGLKTRGMVWGGRREEGLGWRAHVYL